ncbi:TrkH family potassium uptake protein [Pseudalkalibacillus salsuginis]|uniref:TrkH family potassium uptake protein n=1 Tax=Pseudalkalibacillus salsuginis TaxID=2910972 RepID=UPI001F2E74B3|nr:potassium transporter TrkG [Pseudalkalibacillus salsuginis]MCF6409126.1 Ktr system potassium transporter B [Pseudalkalibacillus salsuginis]
MNFQTLGIPNRIKKVVLTPPRILAFSFIVLITVGTLLLKLPIATTGEITWLTALFTATSASTITGLVVVDTGSVYTLFGQIIILSLIQAGGVGIMTFAVLIVQMLSKRIGIRFMLLIQQALNQSSYGGIIRLVKVLLIFALVSESIGTLILMSMWVPDMGWKQGTYASIFYSISGFNSAGFSIWSEGLIGHNSNPVVLTVISTLFVLSGLGFTVILDLYYSRKFKELSLHSKLMIIGTGVINIVALFVIFALEFNNVKTIGLMPLSDKLFNSYFQAVTPRSAGLNSLDVNSMEDASIFFTIILMFIGAGSTSTGGGIKLTTFIALLLSVATFLRGKSEAVILGRTISDSTIIRAFAITVILLGILFTTVFIMMISEDASFIEILFEAVSAISTCGLSMGITGELSVIGQIVIILLMYFGKLGPLTLLFILAKPSLRRKVRYPYGEIITG